MKHECFCPVRGTAKENNTPRAFLWRQRRETATSSALGRVKLCTIFFSSGAGALLQHRRPLRSEQAVPIRLRDSEVGGFTDSSRFKPFVYDHTGLFRRKLVMSNSPALPCLNPLFLKNTSTNAPITLSAAGDYLARQQHFPIEVCARLVLFR